MSLEHEQWLYVAVIAGATILAVTMYLAVRGVIAVGGKWHERLQLCGLALLTLPAAMEWYFSSSLIMLLAVFLCAYGAYKWVKQWDGK